MPYFVLYTALLLLGCFFVGAWFACVVRKMFGNSARPALQTAGAGALAGAGAIAADRVVDIVPASDEVAPAESLFGDRGAAEQAIVDEAAQRDDPGPAAEVQTASEAAEDTSVEQPDVPADIDDVDDRSTEDVIAAEAMVPDTADSDFQEPVVGDAPVSPESVVSPELVADEAFEAEPNRETEDASASAPVEEEPSHGEEPTDVASAVAAASAAAAAAVAAAKASVASVTGGDEAEIEQDEAPVAVVMADIAPADPVEDILPSPDEDGFVFEEPVSSIPAVAAASEVVSEAEPPEDVEPAHTEELTDADDVSETVEVRDEHRQDDSDIEDASGVDDEAADDDEAISAAPPEQVDQGHPTALASAMAAAAAAAGLAASQPSDAADVKDHQSEEAKPASVAQEAAVVDAESALAAADTAEAHDDLTRIKGVDEETQTQLNAAGYTRYAQISSLSPDQVASVDADLGVVGRVSRQGWIEQAAILSTGRETYFSKRGNRNRSNSGARGSNAGADTSRTTTAQTITTGVAAVGGIAGAAVSMPSPTARDETVAVTSTTDVENRDREQDRASRDDRETREARADRESQTDREDRTPREPRPERDARSERSPREPRPEREARSERSQRQEQGDREPRAEREEQRNETESDTKGGMFSAVSERLRGGRKPRSIPGVGNPERRRVVGGGQVLNSSEPDDLKRIRGVGVVIEKKLNAMGVHSYAQIAEWAPGDIEKVNSILDFSGRIERENWIEQAKALVEKA